MVYKNNCQGFIFVMTLSQQIQILYHYFIQELSYETQLETFHLWGSNTCSWTCKSQNKHMFNFLNWYRFQSNDMLDLCYFTSVLFLFNKWNHPHHEKKIFISIFGIEVSTGLFSKRRNHIDNICNITTYAIKILILHVLRICCLFILSVYCSDRIRVVGIAD